MVGCLDVWNDGLHYGWIPSIVVGVDLWKVKLVVIGLRLSCIVLPRREKGLKTAKCIKTLERF